MAAGNDMARPKPRTYVSTDTEAVLWDNDGVLVDTETLFYETTRKAFLELGLELTPEVWAARYLGQGHSSRDIAASMGAEAKPASAVLAERNRRYRQVLEQAPPLRPHVRDTLSALHRKLKMAIVTGCDRDLFELMHRSSGLLNFFDFIVTGDDCAYAKPHPELYLTALKALKVSANRCLAVEDTPRGLAAATAAGVPCLVIPTDLTCKLEFPGAVAIEQDVRSVLKYVRLSTSKPLAP